MRIPAYVYASVALLAGLPATALAGAVVTASISAPAGDIPAGSTVQVICWAEGQPTGGMSPSTTAIDSIAVTVTGGTVTPSQLTGAVNSPCSFDATKTCNVLQGSVAWATSTTAGTFTATCTAAYTTTYTFGSPASGTVSASAPLTTVPARVLLPPVVSPMTGPDQTVVGTTSTFEVTASDPNSLPLTYAWSATGGVVTPNASNPAAASWQAPDLPGTYNLTVTVSNGIYSSSSTKSVSVILAAYQAGLPVPMQAPTRICAGDAGALFAVDGQQGTIGQVALVTARGEARGFASVPEPALAVAHGAGLLWVTTKMGSIYKVDASTGRDKGKVALAAPFTAPRGIAYDATNMALWVADYYANEVRVVRPDGTDVTAIRTVDGAPLYGPIDVAIDAAAGRAWVLVGEAKDAPAPGEPIAVARFLHAFDLAGNYVASYVSRGGAAGQLTRAGGLTVGAASKVYASDAYQSWVQVFGPSGASIGTIGTWGTEVGQLMNPAGLTIMGNGDLAVANTSKGTIDRFGTGAALPVCAGDTDCDLLSDAWETANGLNPSWAGDSLLDPDGDGLNNTEELAHGTNPKNADTDGDGYSDGWEVANGFDPRNPNDHRPVVAASGPAEMPPGLVRLSAVASDPGGGACTVEWTQPVGPAVTLRPDDPAGAATSFVARSAAAYGFDAVAVCGSARSQASRVTVAVRNVPPLADAGRVVVSSPGSSIRLDASSSTDANGDSPLKFSWDQTLGPATSRTHSGGAIKAHPRDEGLYAFQVTVADPKGASATAEVPVVIAAGPVPTAVAAAIPAETQAGGSAVVLDASASLVDESGAFYWQQVAGPAVEISGASQPVASFVPASAGRYAFEVTVGSGRLRSPPARVEVFAAAAGGALPAVTAQAASVATVNGPVALDATGSGGALTYSWRQVSGPAAGLTYADRASATAVPFAPGFYVFEVSAQDGAAESRPVRVAFEARSGGKAIPQAQASAPTGDAIVGQIVLLDGHASTGAKGYRWTQVGGPWVALADAQKAVTTFLPHVPGTYAFELEVDDGKVRSAPAHVQIDVLTAEGVQ